MVFYFKSTDTMRVYSEVAPSTLVFFTQKIFIPYYSDQDANALAIFAQFILHWYLPVKMNRTEVQTNVVSSLEEAVNSFYTEFHRVS